MTRALLGVKEWKLVEKIKTDVANDLKDRMQKELDLRDKIYTGKVRKSIVYDSVDSLVASDEFHSAIVEWGRLPAPVPLEPIYKWVKEKLGVKDSEAHTVAKKIQFKITNEGIKPTRFTKISLETLTKGA